MNCERTKFEAWYDSLYKGVAYTLKDDMELAWNSALASQQKRPEYGGSCGDLHTKITWEQQQKPLDPWHQKDCEYLEQQQKPHTDHPLRHWDRTCPACQEEVKPVPAGLDALVRSLHAKLPMATQEDAIDFAHRLVAELTKGQEPVAWCNLEQWQTGKYWPDDCFSSKPVGEAGHMTPLFAGPTPPLHAPKQQ